MKWLLDRTQEFEEMRFRQKGAESEDPLDFFQRHIESHSFIYSDVGDGPQAVARILRTQPAEWAKDVNETSCPNVDALQNYGEHNRASLIASWLLANQVDSIMANGTGGATLRANGFHRRRRAMAADRSIEEEYDELVAGEDEGEDPKHAMAADQRHVNGRSQPNSKPPWPKGKTVNGYEFRCDDSVVSPRPPKGECYICTSPKHYAQECSHYSRWSALRSANLILADIDAGNEAQELQEYIAMVVECKPSSSYISEKVQASAPPEVIEEKSTPPASLFSREVYVVDALGLGAKAAHIVEHGYHRNRRRREAFDDLKLRARNKGKAVKSDDPVSIPC
jgi:hypothetical protein